MDAEDAVEAAAFAALDVPDVQALADVFQHVPQEDDEAFQARIDAGKGIVIIGDMDAEPIATKDGRGDATVTLTIVAIVHAEERKPVRALKALVLAKLDGQALEQPGWRLNFMFAGSDGFLDPESGEAYVGNFRFTVLAFASA